jgi:hypothetical protein
MMSTPLSAQQTVFDRIDQSLEFSVEERLLLAEVKRICSREIAPHAAQYDREASFPQRSMDAISGPLTFTG